MFTIYRLASMAESLEPDSERTEGALFLALVQDVAAEAWRQAQANDEMHLLDDRVQELADGLAPIYTHARWRTFTDLGAWQEDVSEYDGMTASAAIALDMIAERLISALFEEWRKAEDK